MGAFKSEQRASISVYSASASTGACAIGAAANAMVVTAIVMDDKA